MRQTFNCEICNKEFPEWASCHEHEQSCNPTISKTCYKCGKQESWTKLGILEVGSEDWYASQRWHFINLGQPGYGSSLDGSNVNFDLCDVCLCKFIDSFTIESQEKIYNSGSNRYDSTEDWIEWRKNNPDA